MRAHLLLPVLLAACGADPGVPAASPRARAPLRLQLRASQADLLLDATPAGPARAWLLREDEGDGLLLLGPGAEAGFVAPPASLGFAEPGTFATVDLDGDGWPEVVATAWTAPRGHLRGAAYVFAQPGGFSGEIAAQDAELVIGGEADGYGHLTVADGGDVDGDGLSELLIGRSPPGDGLPAETWVRRGRRDPPTGRCGFEEGALARIVGDPEDGWQGLGAGDLDSDGLSDVFVGAPDNGTLGAGAGAVAVLYGGALEGTRPVDEAELRIFGERAGEGLGAAVAASDLDGDGLLDLITRGRSPSGPPGDAWVFLGRGL